MGVRIKSGFTLIELLVVISIISLLSSVALGSLNEARVKARNAARIAQIRQYILATELAYADTGGYPYNPANTSSLYCLGEPVPAIGFCGQNPGGAAQYTVNATINSTLKKYMGALPNPNYDPVNIAQLGSTKYYDHGSLYGCTFNTGTDTSCQTIVLYWTLEGTVSNCGIANATLTQLNRGARCFISITKK